MPKIHFYNKHRKFRARKTPMEFEEVRYSVDLKLFDGVCKIK